MNTNKILTKLDLIKDNEDYTTIIVNIAKKYNNYSTFEIIDLVKEFNNNIDIFNKIPNISLKVVNEIMQNKHFYFAYDIDIIDYIYTIWYGCEYTDFVQNKYFDMGIGDVLYSKNENTLLNFIYQNLKEVEDISENITMYHLFDINKLYDRYMNEHKVYFNIYDNKVEYGICLMNDKIYYQIEYI